MVEEAPACSEETSSPLKLDILGENRNLEEYNFGEYS
jgi:hypothetical protein